MVRTILAGITLVVVALIGGGMWLLYYKDTNVEEIGKPPADMARTTGLPFPDDASGIHYFLHSGGLQDLEMFTKFDCPASRSDQIVAAFIASNDAQMGRATAAVPPRRTLLAAPFGTVGTKHSNVLWWNPDESKIRKAVLLDRSSAMQFWIMPLTNELTTVYIYQND